MSNHCYERRWIPAIWFVRGNVNGNEFLHFVEKDLLPILMPFTGINPNRIVILDNCSVHHIPGVVSMITEVGAPITKALAVSLRVLFHCWLHLHTLCFETTKTSSTQQLVIL